MEICTSHCQRREIPRSLYVAANLHKPSRCRTIVSSSPTIRPSYQIAVRHPVACERPIKTPGPRLTSVHCKVGQVIGNQIKLTAFPRNRVLPTAMGGPPCCKDGCSSGHWSGLRPHTNLWRGWQSTMNMNLQEKPSQPRSEARRVASGISPSCRLTRTFFTRGATPSLTSMTSARGSPQRAQTVFTKYEQLAIHSGSVEKLSLNERHLSPYAATRTSSHSVWEPFV